MMMGGGIILVDEAHVISAAVREEKSKLWTVNPDHEMKLALLADFNPDSLAMEALYDEGNDLSNVYMSLFWRILEKDVDTTGVVLIEPDYSVQVARYYTSGNSQCILYHCGFGSRASWCTQPGIDSA